MSEILFWISGFIGGVLVAGLVCLERPNTPRRGGYQPSIDCGHGRPPKQGGCAQDH